MQLVVKYYKYKYFIELQTSTHLTCDYFIDRVALLWLIVKALEVLLRDCKFDLVKIKTIKLIHTLFEYPINGYIILKY